MLRARAVPPILLACAALLPAGSARPRAEETPQGFRAAAAPAAFPAGGVPAPVPPALARRQAALARRPTAAGYRALAESLLAAGQYQAAAAAFYREAELHRKNGDPNAAKVEEGRARWWDSRLELYQEQAFRDRRRGPAKYEPHSGCYLGAIVERDDRARRTPAGFNALAGRPHALFFDYRTYGLPFPTAWALRLRDAGAAVQLAFEPTQGLEAVQDDRYLAEFARQAASLRVPVFLRFAGEMNGDWTRYGGQPDAFIRKWRLVHGVMRRLAPNVAMVWTPNVVPEPAIPAYYPGDEFVDWVGINFYAVHHHNNDLRYPADREDPADSLEFLYRRYADRKPLMICEFAATHYCQADDRTLPQFAVDRMRMLYASLPRRYPRVKAVHWYNIDNTRFASRPGRLSNNFSLTADETVLSAYRETVRSPYFLSRVETGDTQAEGVRYEPLLEGQDVSGTVLLSAWARAPAERPVLAYRLDGKPQVALDTRPYEVRWDTRRSAPGPHVLEVSLHAGGRLFRRRSLRVNVVPRTAAAVSR